MKVRDVLDQLDTRRKLAYTTAMTVLDNLHRKQWVDRELDGRADVYRPAFSREEAVAQALRDVLDASDDPEAALTHFVASASDKEPDLMRAAAAREADSAQMTLAPALLLVVPSHEPGTTLAMARDMVDLRLTLRHPLHENPPRDVVRPRGDDRRAGAVEYPIPV